MARAVRLLVLLGAVAPGCSALFTSAGGDDDDVSGLDCEALVEDEDNDSVRSAQELPAACLKGDGAIELTAAAERLNPSEDWYRLVVPDGQSGLWVETMGPDGGDCGVDSVLLVYQGDPVAEVLGDVCLADHRCDGRLVQDAVGCNDDCGAGDPCSSAPPCSAFWFDGARPGDEVFIRIFFCGAERGAYVLYLD